MTIKETFYSMNLVQCSQQWTKKHHLPRSKLFCLLFVIKLGKLFTTHDKTEIDTIVTYTRINSMSITVEEQSIQKQK